MNKTDKATLYGVAAFAITGAILSYFNLQLIPTVIASAAAGLALAFLVWYK